MKKIFFIAVLLLINLQAQNASDYFPAQQGFTWFFKITPFDSLNNPVDSMISYQIDSFATDADYMGKLSHVVLSKYGRSNILELPYLDSSFVYMETSNIWNYFSEIIDTSFGIPFSYDNWYSVFRLAAAAPYTIFTKDTLVTFGTSTLNLRFEVTGRKLSDEQLNTPYGLLNCKKFLLSPAVKYIPPIPIPIPLVTFYDTVWIAPGYYIVKNIQPSTKVDFSLFGYPAFSIPGYKSEAVSIPPVLAIEPIIFNVSSDGDTLFADINNEGTGMLTWNAEVISGNEWITLVSGTSGNQDDSIFIGAAANNLPVVRKGEIRVVSDGSLNSPKVITINQEEGIIVSSREEVNPDEYLLKQNYPNPFNPATTIEFSIKQSGNVKIILYDLLGNVVSVITDKFYSAGNHKINFTAENLSSGIYLYRMISGEFTASLKMTILK